MRVSYDSGGQGLTIEVLQGLSGPASKWTAGASPLHLTVFPVHYKSTGGQPLELWYSDGGLPPDC